MSNPKASKGWLHKVSATIVGDPHALILFSAALIIYIFTAITFQAWPLVGDQLTYVTTVKQIVERGTIQLDDVTYGCHLSKGVDGHFYPKYPLGLPLVLAPFYALFGWIFIGTAVIAAITIPMLYKLCRLFGLSETVSFRVGLIFAFSTANWPYARAVFPEGLITCLIAAGLYFALLSMMKDKVVYALYASVPLGFLFLVKSITATACLPVFLYFILRKKYTAALLFTIALLPWAGATLWYNQILYGNPLKTGYNYAVHFTRLDVVKDELADAWDVPVQKGLVGLFFDPYHGLFVYSPILILALPGLVYLYKQHKNEGLIILLLFFILFIPYPTYKWWWGASSFSSRFIIPATTVTWAVPMGFTLARHQHQQRFRGVSIILALISALLCGIAAFTPYLWFRDAYNLI